MTAELERKIITEDGQEHIGKGFGCTVGDRVCELVFNTSMVGYQEIVSDPSYTCQAVVMTYPLIGSYGMAADDYETERPSIGALIVHEYNDEPSNFRSIATLSEILERYGIPGVSGVDTRLLTRSIRDLGSRKALITDTSTTLERGLDILRSTEIPTDSVARVSRHEAVTFEAAEPRFHVAAIDCGMKRNLVRSLNRRGCTVTALPWNTPAEAIERLAPDGIFVSNGPGDPADLPETIAAVRSLLGRYPLFGVCLGHQLLALACGAKTYKMKFGHRGGNHPVRDIETGRIEITSQNHSYAVDSGSLAGTALAVTHVNLLDGTVEGLRRTDGTAFSVQYHPESAPGPQDSGHLFDRFLKMMEERKNA